MLIEIKSWYTSKIILSEEGDSLKAVLVAAVLSGVDLTGADLSAADLSAADLSAADLSAADLSDADLSAADLRCADLSDADLRGAVLRGAVLRGADLRGVVLRGVDLSDADLSAADLRCADLRGAKVPVIENIDAAILAAIKTNGNSLDMGDWHTCETTHCRAGWAIHLAGKRGYALEQAVGPNAAGALIYSASRPGKPVPDFRTSGDEAMADLEACAAAPDLLTACKTLLEAFGGADPAADQGEHAKLARAAIDKAEGRAT